MGLDLIGVLNTRLQVLDSNENFNQHLLYTQNLL